MCALQGRELFASWYGSHHPTTTTTSGAATLGFSFSFVLVLRVKARLSLCIQMCRHRRAVARPGSCECVQKALLRHSAARHSRAALRRGGRFALAQARGTAAQDGSDISLVAYLFMCRRNQGTLSSGKALLFGLCCRVHSPWGWQPCSVIEARACVVDAFLTKGCCGAWRTRSRHTAGALIVALLCCSLFRACCRTCFS